MIINFMRLIEGVEIISRCEGDADKTVLKNPFIVKRNAKNDLVLTPYLSSCIKGDTVTISNSTIVYSTEPNELISKKYLEHLNKTELIKLLS